MHSGEKMDFQALLTQLASQNATVRASAAQALGENVGELDDDQYEAAKQALNNALIDPDPMVLMSAMSALSKFSRAALPLIEAADDEETELVAVICPVCGKPEMLADPATCEYSNCPYK